MIHSIELGEGGILYHKLNKFKKGLTWCQPWSILDLEHVQKDVIYDSACARRDRIGVALSGIVVQASRPYAAP
jgi:hypothetical protein